MTPARKMRVATGPAGGRQSAALPQTDSDGTIVPGRRRQRRINWAGYAFIAPALVICCTFLLWPTIRALYLSFTDWDLLSPPRWLGLDNYRELVDDRRVRESLWVTGYYVVGTTVLTIPVAFLLAVALRSVGRLRGFFSAVFFMPVMLSTVIASVLFVSVVHPDGGVMRLLPLPFGWAEQNWYQEPHRVIPALIFFSLWKGVGLYVVMFLAALDNLSGEQLEAARLEGANTWQVHRHITIPMLKPAFLFAGVVALIFGFQNFAIVYTSTKGGPGNSSKILPILIYETAFRDFDMGKAAALAMMMLVVVGLLSALQFRLLGERHEP